MQTNELTPSANPPAPEQGPRIKIFGLGGAGIKVMELLSGSEFASAGRVAIATEAASLTVTTASEKLLLETRELRGLGTGGDPERGRVLAEEQADQLRTLCQDAEMIFIVTALGGGAGTGISPVLARIARDSGALVLAFVITPFKCEGSLRNQLAMEGLERLRNKCDGLICLPNECLSKMVTPQTSVLVAFDRGNRLLADAIRGIWRLLMHKGLIEITFADLAAVLRNQHAHCVFAVAEASGPDRADLAVSRLFEHPMLPGGDALSRSGTVLVSLTAGPDLSMAELSTISSQITSRCPSARVVVGAAVGPDFGDCLRVTVIASCPQEGEGEQVQVERITRPMQQPVEPVSRMVEPSPTLPLEVPESRSTPEVLTGRPVPKPKKGGSQLRQGQLPLDIVSKGGFGEPTIHRGEDLDIPTYIRRGVSLN
jgi:cell division protein FtsZ